MRKSTEDLAVNSVRMGELKQRDINARKIIERAVRPLLSDENLEVFTKKFGEREKEYSRSRVLADLRYVQRKRERIKESGQANPILPHAVEYLTRGWLDSGQFFDTGASPENDPPAIRTHDYDDYANGVDVVKTVVLAGGDPEHPEKKKTLTMTFDVTISSRKDVISDKLRQYENGLPYGFTRVKYYAEKRLDGKGINISSSKKMVPRFVIGESATSVEATLKDRLSQDIEGYLKNDTSDSVLTRFKLLSEIYSQAVLFLSKTPEDDTDDNKRAVRVLGRIVDMTEKRLAECADKMTPKLISDGNGMWAPEYESPEVEIPSKDVAEKLEGVDGSGKAAAIIRDALRDKESSIYDEVYDRILGEVEDIDLKYPDKMPKVSGKVE